MKVDVIGSNSLLFANLPPASQVPGRTYRVSDVGPAPGILLTSDGTKYRPAGGRQVLAVRGANAPITIQNTTTDTPIETIATLPGGLLRAGMQLRTIFKVDHSGLGTGNRLISWRIRSAPNPTSAIFRAVMPGSGSNQTGLFEATFDIATDGESTAHVAQWVDGDLSFVSGRARPQNVVYNPSLSTLLTFTGSSADETATNITSATWSGGVVTFTNTAHTLAVGDKTTVAGITPSGYNGVYIVTSVPNANTWTAALAANPGTYTSGGTSSRISNLRLLSYVLELIG